MTGGGEVASGRPHRGIGGVARDGRGVFGAGARQIPQTAARMQRVVASALAMVPLLVALWLSTFKPRGADEARRAVRRDALRLITTVRVIQFFVATTGAFEAFLQNPYLLLHLQLLQRSLQIHMRAVQVLSTTENA